MLRFALVVKLAGEHDHMGLISSVTINENTADFTMKITTMTRRFITRYLSRFS